MVVAPAPPHGIAQHAPGGVHQALVGVDEPGVAERTAQDRQLLGVPAVVLVAEREQLRFGGRHRERPFEVPVEPRSPLGARHGEARVVVQHAEHLLEALRARAVVADDADPAIVGLRPKRLDLGPEQRNVRLVVAMQTAMSPGWSRSGRRGGALGSTTSRRPRGATCSAPRPAGQPRPTRSRRGARGPRSAPWPRSRCGSAHLRILGGRGVAELPARSATAAADEAC